MNTRFDNDMKLMETNQEAYATVILRERQAELQQIERQGRACKNRFRLESLAQECNRLKREYDTLDAMI